MQKNKAKYLVVDTTPFIQNAQLQEHGEDIITIPEVIEEIRSKRQLRHLVSLTYDLQVKDPFSESITFVTEFAKKTGDYACLSHTDIKLIALAYQLETEHVGRSHLRDAPVVRQYDLNPKRKVLLNDGRKDNGLYLPIRVKEPKIPKHSTDNDDVSDSSAYSDEFYSCSDGENENEEEYFEGEIEMENDEEEDNEQEESDEGQEDEEEWSGSAAENESEDDDTGWITPGNFNELKSNIGGINAVEKKVTVGCMSTDFAVQNVLMQIGLNVVALDGRIITQLRTYVLRCYACFKLTTNMRRTFCPSCGNKTLKRVSVFVDKEGNKCININFKKPISAKGKKFSLPLPQGGKHAVNPRLVEDARRPHQKPSRLAKTKTNAFEADYTAGFSPFATRDVYSRSAQHGFNKGKPVFKYWMRRNPNQAKRLPKK